MDTNKLKKALKVMKGCKKNIAKERDKLRSIFSEYESILDSSEQAYDNLDSAIDQLSQYL